MKKNRAQSAFEYMMIVSVMILFTGIIIYVFNVYSTHADLQSQIHNAKQSIDSLKTGADFAYLYAPAKTSKVIYLPPSTQSLTISNNTILIRIANYNSYTDIFSNTEGNLNPIFRNCTAEIRDTYPCSAGCDCGGRYYRVCIRSSENGTIDMRFGTFCSLTPEAGDNKIICVNENTTFDGSYSYSDDAIISYIWDFGDGSNGTGVIVNYAYTNASTTPPYTAKLTIKDENGGIGSDTITVKVNPINKNPSANFVFTLNATVCQIVSFDASNSSDSDGKITSYNWTFSDGITAGGITTTRTFTSPGNYTAELTVYDNGGCEGVKSNTISKSVNIKNILPKVHIISPSNKAVLSCNPLNITGTASDTCGNMSFVKVGINGIWYTANGTTSWKYLWDIKINGNYTICANATDSDNGTSTECINVSVSGCLPNLIPVADTFTPKNTSTSSTVDLCINITNNGGADVTGTFTVRFIGQNESGSGSCGGKKCYDVPVNGLNTGQVKKVCAYNTSTPVTPGNYTFLTAVDSSNAILESNEGDNNYSSVVQVIPLRNIIPVSGTFTPKNTTANSTVDLCISITNNGDADVIGTFTVRFISQNESGSGSCGGKKCYDVPVNGLNTGQVKKVCAYNTPTPETNGNYTFLTASDYFNNITERNETDNNYSSVVQVIPCSARVLNYSWREGWKNYTITKNNGSLCNASNPCNCTGPVGWTTLGFDDSSWSNLTLPLPYADRGEHISFFFRRNINIPGTLVNTSFKVGSDDWFEIFVNGVNITNKVNVYGHTGCSNILRSGFCHQSCCYGSGCSGSAEGDPEGWHDITSWLNSGDNIIAIHLSECGGSEFLDMIFNVTYIPTSC